MHVFHMSLPPLTKQSPTEGLGLAIFCMNLQTVRLSDNQLKSLHECLFADAHRPPELRTLEYVRNKITCDCSNAWIREINGSL